MTVLVLLMLALVVIMFISMIVGAVMFCIDIWKWSKRPEVFTTVEEELSKRNVKEEKGGGI